jgi:capsular polysaccharide biosynthesis protein
VIHPPVDFSKLVAESVIEDRLRRAPDSVTVVRTHAGHTAHVARVEVVYLPEPRLQLVGGQSMPIEAIADPGTSATQPKIVGKKLERVQKPLRYESAFEVAQVDEDVCILSNLYSSNFCHFSEALLRVVVLAQAGLTPRFVLPNRPAFVLEYLRALGLADRCMFVSEPTVFRSALYPTNLWFGNVRRFPDVFFELRERLLAAASAIATPYGKRLWLDRGPSALDRKRDFVSSEAIDKCLDEHGFSRIDMGSVPLLDQIAAAHQAEVIAGPHGAAFTHCMFMKSGSTVIELFSPNYLNHCWTEICRLLNHRYVMLAGTNTPHLPYPFLRRVQVDAAQLEVAFHASAVLPDLPAHVREGVPV